MVTCKYCQANLPDHTRYCGRCGHAVTPASESEPGEIYASPPVVKQIPEPILPLVQDYVPVTPEISALPTDQLPIDQASTRLQNLTDAPTMQLLDTNNTEKDDEQKRRRDDPAFFPLPLVNNLPLMDQAPASNVDEHGLHHQAPIEHGLHRQPEAVHSLHQQAGFEHATHQQPQIEHGSHHQPQVEHGSHVQAQAQHSVHQQQSSKKIGKQQKGTKPPSARGMNALKVIFPQYRVPLIILQQIIQVILVKNHKDKNPHEHPEPQPFIKRNGKQSIPGLIVFAIVIIAVLIYLFTDVFHIVLGNPANSTPILNMPSSASPGEIITLQGQNFTPEADISITLDLQQNSASVRAAVINSVPNVATTFPSQKTNLTVSSNGTFTTKIQIDPSWQIGSKHTIYVLKQDGSTILSKPFTIVAGTPTLLLCGTSSSQAAITLGPVIAGGSLQSAIPFTLCTQGTGQINWNSSWDTKQAPWLEMTHSGTVTAPGKFSVQINATTKSLKAGNYQANVTFSSTQSKQSITLQITLVIQNQNTQVCIRSSTTQVALTGVQGNTTPSEQEITISNCGATYTWTPIMTTSDGSNWLSVNPGKGTLKKGASQKISLVANITDLATGTYTGSVTIGNGTNIIVTLAVSAQQQPCIAVNPGQLTFTGTAGGNTPAAQNITLTNSCSAGNWSATTDQSWFSLNTNSGSLLANASTTATVKVSLSGLSAGTYTGHITFAPGSATVMVTLQIQSAVTITPSATPPAPCISLGASRTTLSVMQGNTSNVAQPISFVDGKNCGSGTWSAQSDAAWITLSKSSGTITTGNSVTTTATINETAAGVGTFNGHITVTAGSSTAVFTVNLTVYALQSITASTPAAVSINTYYATTTGTTRFVVSNQANSGTLTISSITTDDGASWLSAGIAANTVLASDGSLVVPVSVDATSLKVGNYTGHITVTITGSDGGSTSIQVTINLDVYYSNPIQ